ncbi:molybdenum cofactor biosynthesis protein C [Tardibacter chloracetimidivorans]|uniref:Cyclic pyranopterin monophosphate synthase n=1 Tax=Tardibacter chloracetimidivorans TaxID=1921510 RepID=A0A1L3ZRB4_9SPHN|nr:cyclic pyranopterin monophosphate synthase MoaC [Tardibacter chloracetimidivorans]API58163.1 molybdenum cofactor biosynthesis protein C [Tardibacter chloracetimidivorans]
MSRLTHLDEKGAAHMVDVSAKQVSVREAAAEGRIRMSREAADAIRNQAAAKGDVLAVARIAGIMAAKKTADLIPLCHPLPLSGVIVDLQVTEDAVLVNASARTTHMTGVEMEAMTAASVALLTVYDMVKSIDRGMTIEAVRLVSKSGGRSGDWKR